MIFQNSIRQNLILFLLNSISYIKWLQLNIFGKNIPTLMLPSSLIKHSMHNTLLFPYIENIRYVYHENSDPLTDHDKAILLKTISLLQRNVFYTEDKIYTLLQESFTKYKHEQYFIYSYFKNINIHFPKQIYIDQNNKLMMITNTKQPFKSSVLLIDSMTSRLART